MAGWVVTAWGVDIVDNEVNHITCTTDSVSQYNFTNGNYLYIEYFLHITNSGGPPGNSTSTFITGNTGSPNPRVVLPGITIPELTAAFMLAVPLVPLIVHLWMKRKEKIVPRFDFLRGGIHG